MKSYSITDVGEKRQINQDYVFCSDNAIGSLPNLYIVADGMGGHKAGDFASRFCVETFVEKVKNSNFHRPIQIIEDALCLTNELLFAKAETQEEYQGMGTTIVITTVLGEDLYCANVGDSRMYILGDTITQITQDHSLVEEMVKTGEIEPSEARLHPNKNVITRAMGGGKFVQPDYFEVKIRPEEMILMCSDGLSNMLEDKDILDIVNQKNNELEFAVKTLLDKANENGGKDNISIVIVNQ